MGKKYIIDLNPDCVEGEYLRIPARIAGEQQWLMTKAALTPYTEPDLEQVRKEAYDKGFDAGRTLNTGKYEKGLADAWEAARKIQDTGGNLSWWIHNTSASETIEKIRQYEQEQEEIKVGDEVVGVFSDGSETRPFVFIRGSQEYYFGLYSDTGEFCQGGMNMRKTGRSFPEIAAVLEKMRGEHNDSD